MQMKEVKVSIVIPVYNDGEFLGECLDSVLGQSMKEIEVICVDDASTDNSVEILKMYAQRDKRVKAIFYEQNQSASQARKDGVLASQGEYLLFLDGDDKIKSQTCEELYEEMKKDEVDILQFGTDIINWSGVDENRILAMKRMLEPVDEKIFGEDVFLACFREKKYGFSLWNKMYNASVCREAMRSIEDGKFPKAQDKYAFFVIAYFAKSYRGILKDYYIYRFGSGITGHNRLNLKMFERYCTMGLVADAMERFVKKVGKEDDYKDICIKSRDQLFNDVLSNWLRLKEEERPKGFDMMNRYWTKEKIVAGLAQKYWYSQGNVVKELMGAECLRPKIRNTNEKIKTIGTYYLRANGGGAQRVMVLLANMWVKMGYNVVMFTDAGEPDDVFLLDENIQRVQIISSKGINASNYSERAKQLNEEVQKYDIDVMVYHAWVSSILLWDMLICKLNGVAFVSHCHSVFSVMMRKNYIYQASLVKIYELMDAVITLSKVDTCFWKKINSNAHQTVNPVEINVLDNPIVSTTEKNILWMGRFSEEKRPMDALYIMKRVIKACPDVKLFMLGEISEFQKEHFERKIEEFGMENNVELCGFTQDIDSYLRKASVQLITSEIEGFPLALLEGQAYGIPCVMYDLPFLEMMDDNEGIVTVALYDKDGAAAEIIELLQNDNKRKEKSLKARTCAEKFITYDIEQVWRTVFDSLYEEKCEKDVTNKEKLMLQVLFQAYEHGVQWSKKQVGGSAKLVNKSLCKEMLSRKIAFWGTGIRAARYAEKYPELKIDIYIDNDTTRTGKELGGHPIVHASSIQEWKEYFIIITPVRWQEIASQLEQLGLKNGIDFVKASDILDNPG